MNPVFLSVLLAVASYLLGSFSTGLTIGKIKGINLREKGSGNTGASNAMRVMGLKIGIITYAGDFLKSSVACLMGKLLLPGTTFGIPEFGLLLCALFVVLGHNWPVYYHFHGGKGVACSSAVILFIHPLIGGISIAVFFLVLLLTKYISLGSLCMIFCNLILTFILCGNKPYTIVLSAVLLVMSVFRHTGNIKRLLNGNENRIGKKAE